MKKQNWTVDVVSVRMMNGCGNLMAFVDIRVFDALVITQCAVMDGKRGLFASLPRQLSRDGRWRDVVLASDHDFETYCHAEIIRAYVEAKATLTADKAVPNA